MEPVGRNEHITLSMAPLPSHRTGPKVPPVAENQRSARSATPLVVASLSRGVARTMSFDVRTGNTVGLDRATDGALSAGSSTDLPSPHAR